MRNWSLSSGASGSSRNAKLSIVGSPCGRLVKCHALAIGIPPFLDFARRRRQRSEKPLPLPDSVVKTLPVAGP